MKPNIMTAVRSAPVPALHTAPLQTNKQPDTIIISEPQVSLKWRTGQSWLESQLPDINPNFLSGVGAEESLTSLECLQAKPVPVTSGRDTATTTSTTTTGPNCLHSSQANRAG